MQLSFFLGANSKKGFFSFYDELIDLKNADAVYILKGGPGSGKSSLMRKVLESAEKSGLDTQKIYCSSDPDSLDAVVIPSLRKAIVDGTSPHVVEPSYPLAVERYINLGVFADYDKIAEKRTDIISVKDKYSTYFPRAYRFTSAAAKVENELFDLIIGGVSLERIRKKAQGVISREIRGKSGSGKNTSHRFISAVSPKGYINLLKDYSGILDKVFLIEDSFGLSHFFLAPILDALEDSGFPCFVCMSALHPEKIEHLIIPELNLAFFTSPKGDSDAVAYTKKIRLDSMISGEFIKCNKQKLAFLRKLSASMVGEACAILSEAKAVHDDLESIYNPYIDFDSLYKFADSLTVEIIGK